MSVALVSGSAGLIGSETAKWFHCQGFDVVGIDNDMRSHFFGQQASTAPTRKSLEQNLPRYRHHNVDIRDAGAVRGIFSKFGNDIKAVIHTAAQPSHDWAARDPFMDFGVNYYRY